MSKGRVWVTSYGGFLIQRAQKGKHRTKLYIIRHGNVMDNDMRICTWKWIGEGELEDKIKYQSHIYYSCHPRNRKHEFGVRFDLEVKKHRRGQIFSKEQKFSVSGYKVQQQQLKYGYNSTYFQKLSIHKHAWTSSARDGVRRN